MKRNEISGVYSKEVVDFVTVAAEYCVRLEKAGSSSLAEFVSAMLKIVPLIYMKGVMLSEQMEEFCGEDEPEHLVTEEDYNYVQYSVASIMSSYDDFLDVIEDDTESVAVQHVSELLADIYQELRNYVAVFQQGNEGAAEAALYELLMSFPVAWGNSLLKVLKALHRIMYLSEFEEEK